jgi:hypothetical protein
MAMALSRPAVPALAMATTLCSAAGLAIATAFYVAAGACDGHGVLWCGRCDGVANAPALLVSVPASSTRRDVWFVDGESEFLRKF